MNTRVVLIFSPDSSWSGGGLAFNETLCRTLTTHRPERFTMGRRRGALWHVMAPLVPVYDAVRLCVLLSLRRHDVYHLNPSFHGRAILRDALFLCVLGMFRRRNILVFVHGWDDDLHRRLMSSRLLRWLFRATYGRASSVMTLAHAHAKGLEALGVRRERIHVVTTMFDGEPLKRTTRNRADEEVRILYLGRFIAAKGVHELLRAFGDVEDPNARLILAGDGPELRSMREWCTRHGLESRVQFPGFVEGDEKAQLLVDADIFVLPSYGEGCPISLLEAMAAGIPVVVTPVGGIPNVVTHGVHGLMVEVGDCTSLAYALARLVADQRLRAEIGRRNRAEAWKKYEARAVVAGLERHYLAADSSLQGLGQE